MITDAITVLFAVFSLIAIVQRWRGKIRLGFGLTEWPSRVQTNTAPTASTR